MRVPSAKFTPVLIEEPRVADLRRLEPVYREILLQTIDVIIDRFRRNGAYPFIDTKIDAFTGADLSHRIGDIDVYGRQTVYAWIQSRGVEALCGHARWIDELPDLPERRRARYRDEIRSIVERVINALEHVRHRNGGSLFFRMDSDGRPFTLDSTGRPVAVTLEPGVCYGSDMFHVKAVAAAGDYLGDGGLRDEAKRYFARWVCAVRDEAVRPDQQSFDPGNPVEPATGRLSHATRMITLGAFAVYARLYEERSYIDDGLEFIRHILDRHISVDERQPQLTRHDRLSRYDVVEYIDPQGAPYRQDGHVVCDPGHALELVGLALTFLNTVRHRSELTAQQQDFIANCDAIFPQLLRHVFEQGFNPSGGICKSYSLSLRRPLNTDMPWWSLPETMRAAALCHNVANDRATRTACLDIARLCSNAFLTGYVNPRVHLMAYQTLNEIGDPVQVVPATPDLDPGYHTGLSIIDFFRALRDPRSGVCQGEPTPEPQ